VDDHRELVQILRLGALIIENHVLRLRAQEAARSRDDLVAVISHDLRGPLSTFALGLRLVDSSDKPEARTNAVGRMTRSVTAMERLIHDISETARFDRDAVTLTMEAVDPARVIQAAIDELAPQVEHARVRLVAEPGGRSVAADPARLRQAITYLVLNALKRSPSGETVLVRSFDDGEALRVEVRDPGSEVPTWLRGRVFDRMPRNDNGQAIGNGLGLYIARRIAEAHRGTFGVGNDGATFWLRIPR
jgi:signal transduction histidine kinase